MTTDDKIMDEKIQYDINREALKISALSLDKIDKYKYLSGEESRIIEQAKFTYSPLGKAFKKQTKTIEDEDIKQAEALKGLKPEENKQDIKLIGVFFKKRGELMKLKMKYMKLKHRTKKLPEKI